MSRIEGWSSSQGQTPGLEAWLYHLTDRGPWVIKLSSGKCIIRVFEGLIHRNLLKTLHAWQQTKPTESQLPLGIAAIKSFTSAPSPMGLTSPAQAQRRSREQPRSASALSVSGGEEKSEHSEGAHLSTYSDGGVFFSATSPGTRGWPWPWQPRPTS